MRLFVHGAAATPTTLLEALARRTDLEGVTVYHLHTAGPAPFVAPEQAGHFRSVSLFTGAPLRAPIDEGRADFVPIFLSDIPGLFLSGQVKLDAALLTLSVPDRHGFCALGTSVDAARAAADTATLRIAEVNARMPRTRGNVVVPIDRVDAFVANERPLHEHAPSPETPIEAAIGEQISGSVTPPTVVKPTHSSPPITADPEPAEEPQEPPAASEPPAADEPSVHDEPAAQPEPPTHDEPAVEPPGLGGAH